MDDEYYNRMSIKILLKAVGLTNVDEICDTANNGQDAVKIILPIAFEYYGRSCVTFEFSVIDHKH